MKFESFKSTIFDANELDNPCTIINQGTIPVDGVTKNFNPPLPRLPYIDIEFCNSDGTPFEFRGEDHMLVLRLNMLNQPAKYNNYISVDAGLNK
jgi:hypothetical protein